MTLMNFFEPWFIIGTPLDTIVTLGVWIWMDSKIGAEVSTVGRDEIA